MSVRADEGEVRRLSDAAVEALTALGDRLRDMIINPFEDLAEGDRKALWEAERALFNSYLDSVAKIKLACDMEQSEETTIWVDEYFAWLHICTSALRFCEDGLIAGVRN